MASYTSPQAQNKIISDLNEIRKLLSSSAVLNPSDGNTDLPEKSIRLTRKYLEDGTKYDGIVFEELNGNEWKSLERLVMDADTLDSFHASKSSTAENIIPVYQSDGKIAGGSHGEADTAKKLSNKRTFDISGIVTATEQQFDGTGNVNIPITQISINNDQDNAINGILTKEHGGTGRTDGVATDVLISKDGEEKLASKYGQVGDSVTITGKDLDTITTAGNYLTYGTSTDNHYPNTTTSKVVTVTVKASGNYIQQMVVYDTSIFVRDSIDGGASWRPFRAMASSSTSAVTIYVSKSGNDNNSGLDVTKPVLTIQKALQIGAALAPINSDAAVTLAVGEGDWGDVFIYSYPHTLIIHAYDNNTATEYSETLPKFSVLSFYSGAGIYYVHSIVVDDLRAWKGSFVQITNYIRFARTYATANSYCHFALSSGAHCDIKSMTSHDAVLYATGNANIRINNGNINFVVVESLNLTNAFLHVDLGAIVTGLPASFVTVNEGLNVVGKKYDIVIYGICNSVSLDSLPGSLNGTKSTNCVINGLPYGGGDKDTYLCATGSWKKLPITDSLTLNDSATVASAKAVKSLKDQLDTLSSNLSSAQASLTTELNKKVNKAGDTMTGNLTMSSGKQIIVQGTNIGLKYNSTKLSNTYTDITNTISVPVVSVFDKDNNYFCNLYAYQSTSARRLLLHLYSGKKYGNFETDTVDTNSYLGIERQKAGTSSIVTSANKIVLSNGSIWIA